jgi:hypothetical protein
VRKGESPVKEREDGDLEEPRTDFERDARAPGGWVHRDRERDDEQHAEQGGRQARVARESIVQDA